MSFNPSSTVSPSGSRPSAMSHRAALWLQTLILLAFLAASSAPTPLYSVYREAWGFSAVTLTVIFGVYAIALLLALLVLGSISDHVGRRPVIIGALLLEVVAMAAFMAASSVPLLIVARIIQGLATGAATSVLAAGLMDLDRQRSPLINSVAPMVGLAVGALGTSVLVQFAPAPLQLSFVILAGAFVLLAALACFLPETAVKRPGVLSAMLPTVAVPQHAWKALLLVAPIDVAAWALGGFYFSLGPTLIGKVTGMHSPVVGGVLIFVLTVSAAVSVLLLRAWAPQRMLISGIVALIAGVGTTLLAIDSGNAVLFFLGTIVAGFGFGVGFLGALRTLLPLAQPHERAGLMAAYYILSYLAFCLPAILAGIMVSHFGLIAASNYYGLALMALGGAALVGVKLFPVDC
jgi:predicted MFS family arabinose efflux permease